MAISVQIIGLLLLCMSASVYSKPKKVLRPTTGLRCIFHTFVRKADCTFRSFKIVRTKTGCSLRTENKNPKFQQDCPFNQGNGGCYSWEFLLHYNPKDKACVASQIKKVPIIVKVKSGSDGPWKMMPHVIVTWMLTSLIPALFFLRLNL